MADTPKESEQQKLDRRRQRDILRAQNLVNEREHNPGEFGGMAEPPVETHEPPVRPGLKETVPREDLEPTARMREGDIERQGA